MEALCYYCFLSFLLLYFLTKYFLRTNKKLPPSPPLCLPVIGHLHLLKKPMHVTLAKISNQYGPVLLIHFGSRPVLVVSSHSAVEECFTKNDIVLANRPRLLAGKHLGYNYSTLVWASYGPHWRNLRRIASLELLSSHRLQILYGIRVEEVRSLMARLFRGSCDGQFQTVQMKSTFFELTLNVLMRMIAGKRYYGGSLDELEEANKFKEIVTETFYLSGATNVADFVPALKWFGLSKVEKRMAILQGKRDGFMQNLIEKNRATRSDSSSKERGKTMVDVLLSLQEDEPEYYTDEFIRGMVQVMLAAGTDTSSGTMEWALSLLLNNSICIVKAQEEIDAHVGNNRLIEESDIAQLPYLRGIINETLRMCPAAPLIPAHESSEECSIGGFHVPRGTMVLVNMWAIHNDPVLWDEPEKFKPERFQGLKGGFKFLPFGTGRRGCPGENLAMQMVGLVVGLLIQCFEWERVGKELVDMSPGAGLTMPKAQPLLAKCRPRPTMVNLLSQLG